MKHLSPRMWAVSSASKFETLQRSFWPLRKRKALGSLILLGRSLRRQLSFSIGRHPAQSIQGSTTTPTSSYGSGDQKFQCSSGVKHLSPRMWAVSSASKFETLQRSFWPLRKRKALGSYIYICLQQIWSHVVSQIAACFG